MLLPVGGELTPWVCAEEPDTCGAGEPEGFPPWACAEEPDACDAEGRDAVVALALVRAMVSR